MTLALTDFFMERALDLKANEMELNMTVKLILFKNNITPDCDTILGDLTECDFDGYPAGGIAIGTWNPPALVSTCRWRMESDPIVFTPTGTTTPNDVYGYGVYDDDNDNLLWAEKFAGGPITVGGTLIPFVVVARLDERSIP